jgi:sporulation protein YlmC with PRC-barrel domain
MWLNLSKRRVAALGFATFNADIPRNAGRRQPFMTSSNPVISSERVEGTTVYNAAGDKLGTIDDLMIDKVSGQVRYAVMEFGGFLGMGTDRYPIPWPMLKYDLSQDGYVVPLDKAQLEGAPKYASDRVPDYDDTYSGTVDKYYGL